MGLMTFNKIINIKFLTDAGIEEPLASIICPEKGRKPNIEIVGQLAPQDITKAINVKIKNLYMDSPSNKYQRIRIEAGYTNSKKFVLEGDILYMFQSSPGPESETVIQCLGVKYEPWLNKTINLSYDKGCTVWQVLKEISKTLGFKSPTVSSSITQIINVPFYFNGLVKDVVPEIKKAFSSVYKNLMITINDDRISAFLLGESVVARTHKLNYLSSPPQIVGGGDNSVTVTVTAPWSPEIRPGDKVIVDTGFYTTSHSLSNTQEQMTIQVNTLDFHFSTVGSINQMTIMGTKV